MAIAFAQNLGDLNTASGTSLSGTFGSPTVSGNQITVGDRIGATGRTVTVTDSKTNSYAAAKNQAQTLDGHELFVHYSPNIVGGASHQVTVSISGAATAIRVVLFEHSGLAVSSPVDQAVSSQANASQNLDSGAATTTQANELLFAVGAIGGGQAFTIGGGFGHQVGSPAGTSKKMSSGDLIVSSTGTYHGTFTVPNPDDWSCILVTFKAAGAGGGNQAVVPATIAGTSTMSGTVTAQKNLTPATIVGVSAVSAVVRSIDPVAPATITSTSTMAASVRSLDPVAPASVIGSSTLSVALVFKRAVGAAVITGTSVLGGTVSGGSAGTGHRHLAPSIVLTAAPAIAPKIAGRAFT